MNAPLPRHLLDDLVQNHCMPGPGPGLVGIQYRAPYQRQTMLVYVPEVELDRASSAASQASASGESTAKMPTTSAGVAAGSSDSAMDRAVKSRSYTRSAARPSSVRPIRSTMRRRASNGSVLLSVFIGSLSAMVVTGRHATRCTEGGAA